MKKEEFYNFYFKGKPGVTSWEEYSERMRDAVYCCLTVKNAAKNFDPKLAVPQNKNEKESFFNQKDSSTINKIRDILKSNRKNRISSVKELGQIVIQFEVSSKLIFGFLLKLFLEEFILSEVVSIFFPFYSFFFYFFFILFYFYFLLLYLKR